MNTSRGITLCLLALLIPACHAGGSGHDKNSPGKIQFTSSTYSAGESSGTVKIAVARTGGSRGVVSVLYQVADGTAVSGLDYQLLPGIGMLTWMDGDTASKEIVIDLLKDSIEETNETVLLSLNTPTGAELGSPATATLTILDDDSASPAGSLKFEPDTYTFREGVYPLALLVPNVVTVTRVGGSSGPVTVMVVPNGGTATLGVDYSIPIPGPLAGAILSWADGETGPKSVTVDILDDNLKEGKETVLLALQNATGAALIGSPKDATITIEDDD